MYKTQLNERLKELREQEQMAFVNLGKVLGAEDEIQRVITMLEKGEGFPPSPFQESDEPQQA